ncbi:MULTISPECIES: VF530 family DNA-binding protein [unclassified Pseudomonas]|uniref:VF530 family protein n=1 Tax=unclassified Pseudomonas TaxID=196821 RepID=UPI00131E9F76|nr:MULTISPECIES: VF530 family protein [unclassified Pseudomonas]
MSDKPRASLEGITLEALLNRLVEHHGWEELGRRLPLRCFTHEPSIKSSLTFLRRTPWAREKVEQLYRRLPKQG